MVHGGDDLSVPSESGRWLLRGDHRVVSQLEHNFQYPQSRVVGCYTVSSPERPALWLGFQYPQSRVVGCYLAEENAIHAACVSLFTYCVGSLFATSDDGVVWLLLHIFQYPQSRVVGCYTAFLWPWTTVTVFQYPQSRVVGCYARVSAARAVLDSLSVPSESGRWLLRLPGSSRAGGVLSLSVPSESGRWLLPRSLARRRRTFYTFSTLRVGSLVATFVTHALVTVHNNLSVPSESGRWLLQFRPQ